MARGHDRRNSMLGGLAALALLCTAALVPSAALAAAPANDDVAGATAIGSLPFGDTVDTTEATTAADDPDCVGNGHTAWYSFTPVADVTVSADTFGSTFDTTLSAYSGSPGSLTQIACSDDAGGRQSQITLDLAGGQTYHLMVAACCGGPGGTLELLVKEGPPRPPPPPPPPPVVHVTVDEAGTVNHAGLVTLSGRVTCEDPRPVVVNGFLTQTFARRLAIQGANTTGVQCSPPSVPWTLLVSASNGDLFGPGRVQALLVGYACDIDCGFDRVSAEIRLRGIR
jgi:hypothetical protein